MPARWNARRAGSSPFCSRAKTSRELSGGRGAGELLVALDDPGLGAFGLGAAAVAAAAGAALAVDQQVAQFGGEAAGALPDASVQDDPRADAAAQGQVNETGRTRLVQGQELAQGGGVGVVFHAQRQAGPGRDLLFQGHAVEEQHVGRYFDDALTGRR